MRRLHLVPVLVAAVLCAVGPLGAQPFIRGDVDGDASVSFIDPHTLFGYLYGGGPINVPLAAADANDNGVLEIADTAYLLRMIFQQGPPPPAPYPAPGVDTTPPNFPTGPVGTLAFSLSEEFACPGTPFDFAFRIDNLVPMEALEFRIEYDPAFVTAVSISDAPYLALTGFNPDFVEFDIAVPGVIHVATFFKMADPTGDGVPAGVEQHLLDIALTLTLAALPGQVLTFEFVDDPGAVPAPRINLGSYLGQVVLPTLAAGTVTVDCQQVEYLRGDANEDGAVSISDAVFILRHLLLGDPPSSCERTADTNADTAVDIADAIYLLMAYFSGGAPIPPPYPDCGVDPFGSSLDCALYPAACP